MDLQGTTQFKFLTASDVAKKVLGCSLFALRKEGRSWLAIAAISHQPGASLLSFKKISIPGSVESGTEFRSKRILNQSIRLEDEKEKHRYSLPHNLQGYP